MSLVAASVIAADPRALASGQAGCSSAFGDAVSCGGAVGFVLPGGQTTAVAAAPGAPASTIPPANVIYTPAVTTGPNNQLCLTFNQVTGPNIVNTVGNQNDLLSLKLLQTYGICPAAPIPPALAANPAVLAEQFWQTIPLPVPKPSIPPGYAITGKPAYLVTGGTVDPPAWTNSTPLGPLSVTATGSYTVSWGDGTTAGPFLQEGEPYPNGTIAHTYDNVGAVTVTVTETWTATWSLGSARGTLRQLQTTATIPAFPVEQVQAVITH